MMHSTTILLLLALHGLPDVPVVGFHSEPGRLQITLDVKPLAVYVYRDKEISRPYFAHVRTTGGVQVTRNHPPIAGKDAVDHATFHPGFWMAFGDLSGADNWRLRAAVQHDGFIVDPKGEAGRGTFAVRNKYLSADGSAVLCTEVCRYTIEVRDHGYLLVWDTEFMSDDADFTFGDQEEMGLAFRVTTPVAVKHGGTITNSAGGHNEREVWGKTANWCDYSGVVGSQRVGIMVMPHPSNFRPCWFHARDYGLVAANPFGRNAFTRAAKSRVTVKKGERLALRFGLFVYAVPRDQSLDRRAVYEEYRRNRP